MSVKEYVSEQYKVLEIQIADAEEAIKVLKSLGRPTAMEEAKLKTAKQTLANLDKYLNE